MGPTGTQYIMYHHYMTGLHCSFYCFIGPFIVLHESFSPPPALWRRSTTVAPPPLNPLPFAIDAHLSIFACVLWAYFGGTSVTRQEKQRAARKIREGARPLVAAVAAETPRRKWRIGRTLIQFNVLTRPYWTRGHKNMRALPRAPLLRYVVALFEPARPGTAAGLAFPRSACCSRAVRKGKNAKRVDNPENACGSLPVRLAKIGFFLPSNRD